RSSPASYLRSRQRWGCYLCNHSLRVARKSSEGLSPTTSEERTMKNSTTTTKSRKRNKKQKYPPGWNEKRVREVIAYYENQTEEEQLAEHEAAHRGANITVMAIPTKLVS